MASSPKRRHHRTPFTGASASSRSQGLGAESTISPDKPAPDGAQNLLANPRRRVTKYSGLQEVLAFAALCEQAFLKASVSVEDDLTPARESKSAYREQFALDEVLQLVSRWAGVITAADGVAIAIAEENEIILRAASGAICPDLGTRIERDSSFSGYCLRTAQAVHCNDTETDTRVNMPACRRLGARSILAVPLCGRRGVIGLLELFSTSPFAFSDRDVHNLTQLAEIVVSALTPEDEDRMAASASAAAVKLDGAPLPPAQTKAPALIVYESTAEPENVLSFEVSSARSVPNTIRARNKRRLLACVFIAVAATVIVIWWKVRISQSSHDPSRMERIAQPAPPLTSAADSAQPTSAQSTAKPNASGRINMKAVSSAGQPAPTTPQELIQFPRVTAIQHQSSADTSTVEIDLEATAQYETHRLTEPDRIYIDLHNTQLAGTLAPGKQIEVNDALLKRIRVAQPVAGITRVVLETKAAADFSISQQQNPYRLVIEVRAKAAAR